MEGGWGCWPSVSPWGVPAAQAVSQCGTRAKRCLGTAEVTLDVAVYCFEAVGGQAPTWGHLEGASFLGRCCAARSVAFRAPSRLHPQSFFLASLFFPSPPILTLKSHLQSPAPCAHLLRPLPQRGADCSACSSTPSCPCRSHTLTAACHPETGQTLTPGSSVHCLSKGKTVLS